MNKIDDNGIAVLCGNHKIQKGYKFNIDQNALSRGNKLCIENDYVPIYLFDNIGITVHELSNYLGNIFHSESMMAFKHDAFLNNGLFVFERSLKNKASKKTYEQNLSCDFPNIYRQKIDKYDQEVIICSCWGLLYILLQEILKHFNKVIIVSSIFSEQLKKEDVIKAILNFPKENVEVIWV